MARTDDAFGRILFGDDHSPGADVAWLWLHEQRWHGWALDQVRADAPPLGATRPHEDVEPHVVSTDPTRTSFDEAGFSEHRTLLAEADPRVVLMDRPGADLVVVGASGHRFGPDRLGSTAEWLVRHAGQPVAIARCARPVRRALVCADATDPSLRALAAFARMPWVDRVDITLLAVDDGMNQVDAAVAAAREVLGTRTDQVSEIVKAGVPSQVILDVVNAEPSDLAVLGTRGSSGLERLLLGSTAAAVCRHAPASVLVSR